MPQSTEDLKSQRNVLLLQVVESYRENYRELSSEWRAIESKAQGTVTIAGIFIAAIFAFLNQLTAETILLQRLLLALGLLGLITTVLLCVLGLRVRDIYESPLGEETETLAKDLLRLKDDKEIEGRLPFFHGDQISGWRHTNSSLSSAVRRKASFVFWGQVIMVCTLYVIGLLAMTFVFGGD